MSISKKIHEKLVKLTSPSSPARTKIIGLADLPSVHKLIADGLNPIHAFYVFLQNFASFFAEIVTPFPEMKKYVKVVAKSEDEYLPSAPPMSPLTTSFFTTWAFYDLRIDGPETLASCLLDASDVMRLNADQCDALRKMAASRMGIYELIGLEGSYVRLRELLTDVEFTCYNTTGYRGRTGELWYVRLLPPLRPDLGDYWVAFTTPYILLASKNDWMQFLGRQLSRGGSGDEDARRNRLHRLLKFNPDPNYWNEFVFLAYHHHRSDAIFLAGIPDMKATLPHA